MYLGDGANKLNLETKKVHCYIFLTQLRSSTKCQNLNKFHIGPSVAFFLLNIVSGLLFEYPKVI